MGGWHMGSTLSLWAQGLDSTANDLSCAPGGLTSVHTPGVDRPILTRLF